MPKTYRLKHKWRSYGLFRQCLRCGKCEPIEKIASTFCNGNIGNPKFLQSRITLCAMRRKRRNYGKKNFEGKEEIQKT